MTSTPRPALRLRRLWLLAGFCIALLVAVVCLMPSQNLPKVGVSDKFEHALAFGVLAFWFGCIVPPRHLPLLGLALTGFGGLIEVGQGAMGWGRSAEWGDLVADAVGVVAGLLIALTPLRGLLPWVESRLFRRRP